MLQVHPLQDAPKALWPELIQTIADVIGDEAALKMFISLNGRRFSVPRKCHETHFIVQAVGQEKAEILCRQFAGVLLDIPKGSYVLRRVRNSNIR
ncbi:hypothetical protein [Methylomonas koyamae]|uniref:Uncharacterized protein n=1 Tax=Methylomonas koyamae TaxID=702114 RepID=A0A291IG12_9GAMM|nr:hypothetical protein [Methylomonas koyamae]ATG89110.1 hypothetical protein MKLM6_0837 [Methylomonas koyamae]OAI29463.1 hypothetical protein A1356_23080 [Methylomonas koyamae]